MTHDAVVVSLIRYGLTVRGSCHPEDVVNKIDVQILTTAASRISVLPRTTRIEVHSTASYRNLYIRQRVEFVHSSLVSDTAASRSDTYCRLVGNPYQTRPQKLSLLRTHTGQQK